MQEDKIQIDEFNTIYLEKNTGDVVGSYYVKKIKGELVAKTEGYTIQRRTIKCEFTQTKNEYDVIKRNKGYYLILKKDDIVGAFKIGFLKNKIELRTKDVVYNFYSENLGKTYRIRRNRKEVGIINSNNWLRENIKIVMYKHENLEIIILTVIGIAYDICTSPLRFFKE